MSETTAMKTQWDLELNEFLDLTKDGSISIRRVPGGWIYWSYYVERQGGAAISQVFVPYSEEFNPALKPFIGANEEESE